MNRNRPLVRANTVINDDDCESSSEYPYGQHGVQRATNTHDTQTTSLRVFNFQPLIGDQH